MKRDRFNLFDEYMDGEEGQQNITCKRCGADELHWEEARGERNEKRWVLLEADGTIHVCPGTGPADADEFPVEGNQ